MKFASIYILSLLHLLVCCGPAQTDVSLRISPDRSQFFKHESISLSCEAEGNSSLGWSVKRQTSKSGNETCTEGWGNIKGVSCIISLYSWDNGVYWCESEDLSRSINITISVGQEDVILESPVLPVMEGKDVTLRCLSKDKTTDKISSDLPADFYKNGSLIRTESTGQMTIYSVYKSDEGFYKCNISDLRESPESWMGVKASNDNNKSPSFSLPPYFYPLMLAGVSIILLILGLCLWKKYRGCRTDRQSEDVTYAAVTVKQRDKPRKRDQTSEEPDIYSILKI